MNKHTADPLVLLACRKTAKRHKKAIAIAQRLYRHTTVAHPSKP